MRLEKTPELPRYLLSWPSWSWSTKTVLLVVARAAKPRAANSGPRSRSLAGAYNSINTTITITHNAMSQSRPYVAISLPPSATPDPATATTTTATTPPRSPSCPSTSPYPSKRHQPISPLSSVPSYSRSQLARRPRRVLQYIRRIYHGRLSTVQRERYRRFTLLPTEWTALQNAVFAGRLGTWARDKLRWDYDADTHQVTLRMLSPLHEKFIRELERLIFLLLSLRWP
jgi:hypothetical protein